MFSHCYTPKCHTNSLSPSSCFYAAPFMVTHPRDSVLHSDWSHQISGYRSEPPSIIGLFPHAYWDLGTRLGLACWGVWLAGGPGLLGPGLLGPGLLGPGLLGPRLLRILPGSIVGPLVWGRKVGTITGGTPGKLNKGNVWNAECITTVIFLSPGLQSSVVNSVSVATMQAATSYSFVQT